MRPRDSLPGAADTLPDPFQDSRTQRATPRTDSGTAPARQRPRQATTTSQQADTDKDVVSITAASGAASSPAVAFTSTHGRRSTKPTSSDLASVVASQTSLQEHLALAAKSGHELLQRSEEQENKALMEYNRQSRKSAVDWCHMAKMYEQDRNLMALRLRELELQLSQVMHKETKGTDSTKASGKAVDRTGPDGGMIDDPSAFSTFVSQSITQILDDVSPKNGQREPDLPRLSKGNYSIQAEDAADQDPSRSVPKIPRSALKNSAASSTSCSSSGCQAEIKAWKARCDYAENRLTVQELRYEQKSIMMETISAKWAQWRQKVLRQQYQRRLQAAMTPADSRAMSLHTEQPQNAEPKKRARFSSTASEEYRQRMEATQKNTILNQFNSGYLSGSMDMMGSTSVNSRSGVGSAAQPHELLGDTSSDDDGGDRAQHGMHKPRSLNLDGTGDEEPSNQEYGSQPMSLTFPSELAIRRRLYVSEPEDEEGDESHGDDQPFTARGARGKTSTFKSVSPTTRACETRNLTRPVYGDRSEQQQREVAATAQATVNSTRPRMDMPTIESDRSSPPMFDSTDYLMANSSRSAVGSNQDHQRVQPPKDGPPRKSGPSTSIGDAASTEIQKVASNQVQFNHPRTPKAAQGLRHDEAAASGEGGNGVGPSMANSTKVTPDQPNRVFVPETPLELQGITPQKKNSQNPQPVTTGTTTVAASRKPGPPIADAMVIDLPDEDYQTEAQSFEDEPDKENRVPKRTRGPEALIELDSDEYPQEEVLNTERYQQPQQEHGVPPPPPAQRRPQQHLEPGMANGTEERIYNYTERRKDKRRQMHGHDCACCRRFYELTGPLPLPDGYNAFFTPAPRPGEKEVWEMSGEERLQQRIQATSRHRVQHEVPLTPPGFWDTTFPPTQEGEEWDRIAEERRQRKKTRIEYLQKEQDQQRQQQQEQNRALQQQQNRPSSSTMRRFGMNQSEDEVQSGTRGRRSEQG
ncbi:hypothetical protein BGZ68_006904 [Mortierella alpina]|nr:hypothetical protein BGZ68_006904 [Mortierella alpina]